MLYIILWVWLSAIQFRSPMPAQPAPAANLRSQPEKAIAPHPESSPEPFLTRLERQLSQFHERYPAEKVYVMLDKPHYALGDNIWCKAFLVEGRRHLAAAVSTVVYAELIDPTGKILARRNLNLAPGSSGAGDFLLEPDWPAGQYRLRAYTNFMRNFPAAFLFERSFPVWDRRQAKVPATNPASPAPDFDLAFCPEGGDLVAGLPNTVGLKALGPDGRGIEVSGRVYDAQHQFVGLFRTLQFGLGIFSFTPQAGQTYTAEVEWAGRRKTWSLPPARPQGYLLKINHRQADKIGITVLGNDPAGLENLAVVGHLRGNLFCALKGKAGVNNLYGEVATRDLPTGVAHFTLFNNQGQPLAERLVFLDNNEPQPQLVVNGPRQAGGPRTRCEVALQLLDGLGQPLVAQLALSVTAKSSVTWPEHGLDLRSYLLLQSDLAGPIESPGFFFDPQQPSRRQMLDLLMLTQGWRRFTWREVLQDSLPPAPYFPERGFTVTGQIMRPGTTKGQKGEVLVSSLGADLLYQQTATDEEGFFSILGFQFADTTTVLVQASRFKEDKKERKNNQGKVEVTGNRFVDIRLVDNPPPPVDSQPAPPLAELSAAAYTYLRAAGRLQRLDSVFRDGMWSIDLAAVEVKSRKRTNPSAVDAVTQLYGNPDRRLILDSIPGARNAISIFDLIRSRFPGVVVNGVFPNQTVTIRGISSLTLGSEALFLLDGVVIDANYANNISVQDIAYIDLLTGAAASILGSRGANGAISIFTRRGGPSPVDSTPPPGIFNFIHPGYYRARTFYEPRYPLNKANPDKPDYRTTLHWVPELTTDERGQAVFSFFRSDEPGLLTLRIEGITRDGRPIFWTGNLQ